MSSSRFFRFSFFLLFFLAFGKNTEAAISTHFPKTEAVRTTHFSKKEKRKKRRHILKKWKAKFFKKTPSKERKNKFGRLGLIILLGGLVSLFITDVFFGLALLAGAVLGLIGIFNDEDKLAAWVAFALPVIAIGAVLIIVANIIGE